MQAYRIAIQGADTLLGKELASALLERHFPALEPRLLAAPAEAAAPAAAVRGLLAFGGEAALVEPCTAETLADADALFLAGSAEQALTAAALAPAAAVLIDLTGALAGQADAAVAGLEPEFPSPVRTAVIAHPAAQALALLLARLEVTAPPRLAAVTVFEPVSQRGWPGLQELEQQTRRLLALQSLPEEIFGCQVAFNLRAALGPEIRPSLGDSRRRIAAELRALRGDSAPAPALTLLQAPSFHACLLSLYARWDSEPSVGTLAAALASPWLAPSRKFPDVVSAAGADAIQLGPLRPDPAGGVWLFASLDNLRRSAFSAVDAALALLAQRRAS